MAEVQACQRKFNAAFDELLGRVYEEQGVHGLVAEMRTRLTKSCAA